MRFRTHANENFFTSRGDCTIIRKSNGMRFPPAQLSDTKDSFGLLARFTPPTVANGKVFVATAGGAEPLKQWCAGGPRPTQFPQNYGLAVYGLKP